VTLSGKSRIAGILGWPVSHSLSPRVHGFWLREHGIDGAYIPLPVDPKNFAVAVRALPQLGFRGANVTVPHKEAAFRAVDVVDPMAERLGTVNTIIVTESGKLEGRSTDGYGFMGNLCAAETGWRANSGAAMVLGAGGAARAVVAALLEAGVNDVRLSNRTCARAEAIASEFAHMAAGEITVVPWEACAVGLENAALLVNTTTLGMIGHPALYLPLNTLPLSATVMDIVYTPLETELLAAARARGNPVVDGLGMLLHQARAGFAAWFGVEPQVTADLRRFVLDDLEGPAA
jgi:shikimate dehydrogenase